MLAVGIYIASFLLILSMFLLPYNVAARKLNCRFRMLIEIKSVRFVCLQPENVALFSCCPELYLSLRMLSENVAFMLAARKCRLILFSLAARCMLVASIACS